MSPDRVSGLPRGYVQKENSDNSSFPNGTTTIFESSPRGIEPSNGLAPTSSSGRTIELLRQAQQGTLLIISDRGTEVKLTPREREVVELLPSSKEKAVTTSVLLGLVNSNNVDSPITGTNLSTILSNLRKKGLEIKNTVPSKERRMGREARYYLAQNGQIGHKALAVVVNVKGDSPDLNIQIPKNGELVKLGERKPSVEPSPTERGLVSRATARDRDAFEELYKRHADRVYRYIYYKVGSVRLAEDFTQQIFLQAWEAIDRFQWREIQFEHWLLRIARNAVIDFYRSRRQETAIVEGETVSADFNSERHLIASEQLEVLEQAILRLPQDQSDVIILRFIEERSFNEVAQILGKSPVAVRVIQTRALSKLKSIARNMPDLEHAFVEKRSRLLIRPVRA